MKEEREPFSYTVVCPGNTTPFLYAQNDDGTTAVSLFALTYGEGRWWGPDDGEYSLAQFGDTGAKLSVWSSVGGLIQFPTYELVLAFSTAVDLAQPLPLGSLLLADCSYAIEFSLPPPPESSLAPVEKVLANNVMSAGAGFLHSRNRSGPFTSLFESHRALRDVLGFFSADAASLVRATPEPAHPSSARTTRFANDGTTVKALITCDFTRIDFDSRRVTGGTMALSTAAPDGTVQATTSVQLAEGGTPVSAVTCRYGAGGTVVRVITTDYQQLRFGPGNHIIGGTLLSRQTTVGGVLIADTQTVFGPDGFPRTISTRRFDGRGSAIISAADTDYSYARFDAGHRVIGGIVRSVSRRCDGSRQFSEIVTHEDLSSTTTTTNGGTAVAAEKRYLVDHRADQTLARAVLTSYVDGNPAGTRAIDYEPDGRTPVLTTTTDYTSAIFDDSAKIVGGTVHETAMRRDGSMASRRETSYAPDGWSQSATSELDTQGAPKGIVLRTFRPNGTCAYERNVTAERSGQVRRLVATTFLLDGVTVNEHSVSDFSGVVYDGNEIAGGSISTATSRGDGTAKALTTTQFAR